jgi:hypothetical protein
MCHSRRVGDMSQKLEVVHEVGTISKRFPRSNLGKSHQKGSNS